MSARSMPAMLRVFGLAATIFFIGRAMAGEIADVMVEVEGLIDEGDPAEIWAGFDRATELFWAEAPLAFRAATLADNVAGFGQYQPRADNLFAPGDRLTVYLEPVGYGWTAIGTEFRIRFSIDIEIVSQTGGVTLAEEGFALIERLARNRSREFQATISMTLPALPAGPYQLRLTFHDDATGKSAVAEVPFQVTE